MTRCCIALGGNIGPVQESFSDALSSLNRTGCHVECASSLYRSAPVATGPAARFLNAAAVIETGLDPEHLLDLLQSIENQHGRTRERRWTSRTLDLDLVFFGETVCESPRLTVPHPAAWFRRFVLEPVVELMPGYMHPVKQVSLETLQRRLLPRPQIFALAGAIDPQTLLDIERAVASVDCQVVLWDDRESASDTVEEPTFIVWRPEAGVITPIRDRRFLALPLVPRIDATRSNLPLLEFVHYLHEAAMGDVERIAPPGEWWRQASISSS